MAEQVEPTTPLLKTKPSVRGLNAPAGGRPKSRVGLGRSATISTPSPPSSSKSSNTKSSPGRGGKLTVRIEDDMTGYAQLIKSAPVKTIRKLPVPPMPATAVECSVNGFLLCAAPQSDYAEPYSAPASLHPLLTQTPQTPQTPRMVRPLPPCPPPPYLLKEVPRTPTATFALTPTRTSTTSPPPTERAPVRVVKPLPVPVIKVEPMVLPRNVEVVSSRPMPSTPPSLSSTPTPTPTRPRRTAENTFVHEKPKANLSRSEEAQRQSQSPPKREPDVIHLKFRHKPSLSLDSDTSTSDDEYGSEAEPTFRHSRLTLLLEDKKVDSGDTGIKGGKGSGRQEFDKKGHDLENCVDYTWMLSNRKLYRLDALTSQQVAGGKWLWEKKGKRMTEQDFENVLHMLRTL